MLTLQIYTISSVCRQVGPVSCTRLSYSPQAYPGAAHLEPRTRTAQCFCRHALEDIKPRDSDTADSLLILQRDSPSPSFCTIILHNWSNTTASEVFALHRSSEFRKLIRLWNPVSAAYAP